MSVFNKYPQFNRSLLYDPLDLETKKSNLKIILKISHSNLDTTHLSWDGKMGSKIFGLICNIHLNPKKIWEPYLNNLLKGCSCPSCANDLTASRQRKDFIGESKLKHGENRFGYSKCFYKNGGEEVILMCLIHNEEFPCTPPEHLTSKGGCCPSCRKENTSGSNHPLTISLDELIERIDRIWGDRFEYDFTGYTCLGDYIKITCPKCNRTWQSTANNHVHPTDPRGCITCGRKVCADKLRMPLEEFIKRANLKHNNKYTYNNFIYNNNNQTKSFVTCKEHGDYPITPADHLGGSECPSCTLRGISKGELEWLDYQSTLIIYHIIYKGGKHKKQESFRFNGKLYRTDGYCEETKTIYEFLGCWHHGCNKCGKFDEEHIHAWKNKTMKELNEEFEERKKVFEENGYNVVYIWECDWNTMKKELKIPINEIIEN